MQHAEGDGESMDVTEQQARRLDVVRCYHTYVSALHSAGLDHTDLQVQRSRRALASAIEDACRYDPHLLDDFRRTFAVRRSR